MNTILSIHKKKSKIKSNSPSNQKRKIDRDSMYLTTTNEKIDYKEFAENLIVKKIK